MKVIALVGCPNVGKSTLFNRLTKTRDALVADFPGLTRDRKYGRALFDGREYIVVDTGGIADDAEQPSDLTYKMTSQAYKAIEECDLVIFMVDARAGLVPGDYAVADFIRRSGKPYALVANKIDGLDPDTAGTEFYALGLGEIHLIAASHGRGVTSLIEEAIAPLLREEGPLDSDLANKEDEEDEIPIIDIDVTDLNASRREQRKASCDDDLSKEPYDDEAQFAASLDEDEIEEDLDLNFADQTFDEDLSYEELYASVDDEAGADDEDLPSDGLGRERRLSRKEQHESSDWEQGYEFLDNVPADVRAGGFDWHTFKENKKAREHGEEEKELASAQGSFQKASDRETPFSDLPVKFALVGKPNVGKSTLTNRLIGEDRVVVCDMPGTTRDSIYIPLERDGKKYIVIDTAGVRRRAKVNEMVEKFSIVKTLKAIEDCNVAVLIIDAREHITDQDLSLLGFILDSGRSLVVAVNKWDGLDQSYKDEIRRELDQKLGFVNFARVHFISALHGTGVGHLFDSIDEAYESATRRHSSSTLNRILQAAVQEHEPPVAGGRRIKLKYAHAGGYNPPRIVIHGNKTSKMPDYYRRYLINCYRKALKIMGTPVIIELKEGANPYADEKPAQRRLTLSKIREQKREEATQRRYERAAAQVKRKRKKELEEGKKHGLIRKGKGAIKPKK